MPEPRYRQVSVEDTPYYHCISRCVRRAFLCGKDSLSGFSFEHRRQWIVDRIKLLCSVFAVDLCAYAVMSNHYHIVIRIDAEQAKDWSDEEVARRWMQIFAGPLLMHQHLGNADLTKTELERVAQLISIWRDRLCDISWFMRCINEPIARMANAEDHCTGRFWEGRFRSQALLDARAVLACMAYVDLNPIRAATAKTPEQSDYTSIQERILQPAGTSLKPFAEQEVDGLPFKLKDYLELVDWGGREVKRHKRGHIPAHAPSILTRLKMDAAPVLDYLARDDLPSLGALGPERQFKTDMDVRNGWNGNTGISGNKVFKLPILFLYSPIPSFPYRRGIVMLNPARVVTVLFSLVAIFAATGTVLAQQTAKIQPSAPTFEDRQVLPIKAPYMAPITTMDARDMDSPEVFEVTAPKGAPNVIIVLVDDLGFGGTSHFGGPVPTPTFDRLANEGVFYNQFHSTALCSPTRQALKTGRNHHSAAMGKITELATSFPGYTGVLPDDVASIGKMLNYNGFSTAAFGKWHETAVWEISPSGPMTRWPNHQGFDEFYGFMGGETNQWTPTVYHNQNRVETPEDPSYHFLTDMTTKAIEWIEFQQSLTPEKPFFVYFAPGATHAPHHVPQSYIDKQKGRFDAGWDVLRNEIYQRQLKSGMIPKGTKLATRPDWIKDWKDLSADEQKLFARQAEVFAAYVDMTDTEIGRLVKAVEDMGEINNTLIFYIAGDNGTSAEGVANGLYNEMTYFNAEPKGSDVEFMLQYYDKWGGPETYPHMAAGWAVAYDSPFAWTKQVASDYGGTRQGMAIHWPDGIKSKGELRSQWHHVIDVVPTILEAAGLPEPKVVDGVPQKPIEGVSMVYSFDNARAADRHTIQYFEMFGNRALYDNGWMVRTIHVAPWGKPVNSLKNDTWELYHVAEDFSMSTDVAKKYPERVAELQDRFLAEALKYNVLPLDDRRIELANPQVAGRPDLMFGRTSLTLSEGMAGLLENDFINTKNTSYTIEAEVDAGGANANGVILAQGGRFGGYSLYVKDGTPIFAYNYLGLDQTRITGTSTLPSGMSTVKMDFVYDGGRGGGGTVTLSIDGKPVGSGRIAKTEPNVYSADETAGVGVDLETPVTDDYTLASSKFTGSISKVTINTTPSD